MAFCWKFSHEVTPFACAIVRGTCWPSASTLPGMARPMALARIARPERSVPPAGREREGQITYAPSVRALHSGRRVPFLKSRQWQTVARLLEELLLRSEDAK